MHIYVLYFSVFFFLPEEKLQTNTYIHSIIMFHVEILCSITEDWLNRTQIFERSGHAFVKTVIQHCVGKNGMLELLTV